MSGIPPDCQNKGVYANGKILYDGYTDNDPAVVECDEDYRFILHRETLNWTARCNKTTGEFEPWPGNCEGKLRMVFFWIDPKRRQSNNLWCCFSRSNTIASASELCVSGHHSRTSLCVKTEKKLRSWEQFVFIAFDTETPVCPIPPSFENAEREYTGLDIGEGVIYTCYVDHIFSNFRVLWTSKCNLDGQWDNLPTGGCVRKHTSTSILSGVSSKRGTFEQLGWHLSQCDVFCLCIQAKCVAEDQDSSLAQSAKSTVMWWDPMPLIHADSPERGFPPEKHSESSCASTRGGKFCQTHAKVRDQFFTVYKSLTPNLLEKPLLFSVFTSENAHQFVLNRNS